MTEGSGFYKLLDDGTLAFGPNGIFSANYELYPSEHDTYVYPVFGWYWFDTRLEARTALLTSAEVKQIDPMLMAVALDAIQAAGDIQSLQQGIFRLTEAMAPLVSTM